jgi:riboflavin synthase
MFTGIIEEIGTLRHLRRGPQSATLEIAAHAVLEGTRIGDSINTDGTCLTVTTLLENGFRADAQPETVRRTTLADLRPGAALNLERALSFGSRLGGHLVTGHVDGVGTLVGADEEDNALVLKIAVPPAVARMTVAQGSLAVNGVSLTVVDLVDGLVRVSLIPHTARVTTLGRLRPGDHVNLEVDLIGRYVISFLERTDHAQQGTSTGGLSWDTLAGAGF